MSARDNKVDGAPGGETAEEGLPIEGPSDERAMLNRLSLSMMGCQPELSKNQKKDIAQAIIYGELSGLTGAKELPNAKSDDEKYTYGLVGKIEGVNLISGEIYRAGVLYLPGGFHDMFLADLEAQLRAAGEGEHVTIQFALEFISTPANNKAGYSWKARNKMPPERRDSLASLRRRALAGVNLKRLEHRPAAD